jgi:hypothetical protein
MAYIVVKHFTDLQDHGYKYAEGDTYPREGYEPSAERIEMLSTPNNRQRTVLIKAVESESAEIVETSAVEESEPTTITEEITVAEEKPKKRSRKK